MALNKTFVQDAVERAAKTFVQFYLGFWLLTIGLLNVTSVSDQSASAFDALFTWDNAKAGVVGVALSVATSVGSKPFGSNKETASIL